MMRILSSLLNPLRTTPPHKSTRINTKFWQGSRGAMSTMATPMFRKQKEDGSEEEISEEELYRYTRYRWLTADESENLATRYRKFNISALVDVAVTAAGDGAGSCVKVLKCLEGQYNKAFIMTMENGAEVLAKIPNPNAGPAFYTTASEVATRYLLRTGFELPVPRIHAHSTDPANPVGAEYIIEEKANGKQLGSVWYQWDKEARLGLVTQLVDLQTKLASISFQRHGCVYFKKDLEKHGIAVVDLEARSSDSLLGLNSALTEEFAFGPLTDSKLWKDERATTKMDRGPWSTPQSYMTAMGSNEIRWAMEFAEPQINVSRSIETPAHPADYILLLRNYLQLVPHLSPAPFRTTLSHPDLHLDNIFVDPDTKKITCIIDWQSASISEPFFQQTIPRMLSPKRSSSDEAESESNTRDSTGNADLLDHYQNLSRLNNEQYWTAMNLHNRGLLTNPTSLLCGAWSRNDVFSFRDALIYIAARWEEIAPETTPCPIEFTKEELEAHSKEMEVLEGLGMVLQLLKISPGGMVLQENYEEAVRVSNQAKEMFVSMVQSEEQKALFSRIWPYQDRAS